MIAANFVRIGRPTPVRASWMAVIIAAVLIAVFGTQALIVGPPEHALIPLMFLLIPVIGIPLLRWQNTYAVLDTVTWQISLNGGAPRPIGQLVYCRTDFARGISTLTLGFSDLRSERVAVSSNTPFGSPRGERDWVRYILPYTGLRRVPGSRATLLGNNNASLEQAQEFAQDWLK